MTLFDLIALVIIAVSALVGFVNGAVREVIGIFAFGLAIAAALLLLPLTGPIARHSIHPGWAASVAAVVVVFIVAYIALKLAGHFLTRSLRTQAALGALDRAGGGLIGLVRALVILGVFFLVYNAATPAELRPTWIEHARLLGVARLSGQALQNFAPKGLAGAGHLGGLFKPAGGNATDSADDNSAGVTIEQSDSDTRTTTTTTTTETPPAHRRHRHAAGYEPGQRRNLDALVERSR